jgi:hypothetical protein
MASHIGRDGVVQVGSTAIAEVKSFSLDESAEQVETTSMTDTARAYKVTVTSWSGSVDVFWDETDTAGQGALTVGAEVTLKVMPEGAASGATFYTGTCQVTSISRSASFDGMVEATISVTGNGALTSATV